MVFAPSWRGINEAFDLQQRADAQVQIEARREATRAAFRRYVESRGENPGDGRVVAFPDADGLVTAWHWGRRKGLKSLDPARWGESWEVLPTVEKGASVFA
jgi:hypothetical protein